MRAAGFVIILLLILAGCAPTQKTKTPTINELTTELDKQFDTSLMHSHDAERVASELGVDISALEAYEMKVPTSTNMDEYGIFIAATGREKEVSDAVSTYLQQRKDRWMDEYLPEERPKIFEAQTRTIGKYVIFVMAFEPTRGNALASFDSLVK